MQKRAEDFGITIGEMPKGRLNKITDVKGIKVGHCTIDTNENKTGITVIMPSENNIFKNKFIAANYVLNGYAKSIGTLQIDELGVIESPIVLTNTLNVGLVADSVVEYTIEKCKQDNIDVLSFNPVVCECNDSDLNNIQNRAVKSHHVFSAIEALTEDFAEGDVGGGKGMACHGLKGGIGSASRIVTLDEKEYTVGVLVQSNHGKLHDLNINGREIGKEIEKKLKQPEKTERGSIITVVATDIPMTSRQLRRVCKRIGVGFARLGSYIGHGSGEIMVAFSTGNVILHEPKSAFVNITAIDDSKIDDVFKAAAEATEEAVLNSMLTADTVTGFNCTTKLSLKEFL